MIWTCCRATPVAPMPVPRMGCGCWRVWCPGAGAVPPPTSLGCTPPSPSTSPGSMTSSRDTTASCCRSNEVVATVTLTSSHLCLWKLMRHMDGTGIYYMAESCLCLGCGFSELRHYSIPSLGVMCIVLHAFPQWHTAWCRIKVHTV